MRKSPTTTDHSYLLLRLKEEEEEQLNVITGHFCFLCAGGSVNIDLRAEGNNIWENSCSQSDGFFFCWRAFCIKKC